MPGHDYKRPGLIRAGFQYQDLVAVEILIDFYRQRDLYAWVQLDTEDRAFRSIEDVVACRPDGLYELTQVKFTADPDAPANLLSWRWLTANGGARKSLLQKWARTTLNHKVAGTLARANLKTDRVPDAAFANCLKGTMVDYTLLLPDDKALVEEQLGSPEAAESFFENFEFVHSQPRIDDLEDKLWKSIASDTDRGGWALFKDQVQRWSMRKGQPAPDGRIKYIHLRQAFAVERSKPLPQGFLVPHSYSVPDEDFDRTFLEKITGSDGVVVLWGPPGRGKSTYLSHCVARIDRKNAICIRHHYFLSLDDRSDGRYHYHAIARSLSHQIEQAIPNLGESRGGVGELLETAALHLQGEGRKLIVVVDGLDHVWRDHRDHEDMEALFDALLPLPANVTLVVGTQKIDGRHLPARLLNALPTERWTELPLMSRAAVHGWLHFQDEAGRLNLEVVRRQTRGQVMRAVASTFHDITQGLPLHLIYAFEALVRTGSAVTAEAVAALPACPTGDIRDYYRSFWGRINEKARTILHALAGLEFGPPPFAMQDCFGRGDKSLSALAEINHVLDYREMEVRPFHGSLFAFVRDLPEHESTFTGQAPEILTWLEMRAPEYWRWAWLWITKAQLGDPSEILAAPNREWAINSLVAGLPIEQLTVILDYAETAALEAFDLPRLLNLRCLKTRALNGPEFQTDQWPVFLEVAISLSDDVHVRSLRRAELHRAPTGLLPFIVRSADESIGTIAGQAAIDELNLRIARHEDNETVRSGEYSELIHAIVAVVASDGSRSTQRVLEYAKGIGHADALVSTYVHASILAGNFDNVFSADEETDEHHIDRDVLAALCFEGLAPAAKPGLRAITHPAIRCLALVNGGDASKQSWAKRDLAHFFGDEDDTNMVNAGELRGILYEIFFDSLAAGLSGSAAQGWSEISEDAATTWLCSAIRALERLASGTATRWVASKRWPTLQDVYGAFELQPPTSHSHVDRSRFIAVRLALGDVAVDLCTIAKGLDSNALIDVGDIESVSMSPFWLDEIWLEIFSERRLPLHAPEAAQAFVERLGRHLGTKITEFNERATTFAKLAMFASDHGLVRLAQKELRRAVGCLLGYGWRKDIFAFEVLESLDLLASKGDTEVRKAILQLAGEFEAITDYTDGDETNHARREFHEAIVAHFPERVPACYAHLIRDEEWSYAERLAIAFSKTDLVESRAGRALLESYVDPSEIRALEKLDLVARPHTRAALAAIRRKTGGTIGEESEDEEATAVRNPNYTSDESECGSLEVSAPDPSEFPPGRLEEYLNAISDLPTSGSRRELATEWLRYWAAVGLAGEALTDLEDATSMTGRHMNLGDALDVAFEIALEVQGRSKAFPWLIRAHVAQHGWSRWFTSNDEAQARMQAVTKHYRGQWREFIQKTATSIFATHSERNGIVIGLSRLVYFLVGIGELSLAREYTLEMARIFKEELMEQPIETPMWSR